MADNRRGVVVVRGVRAGGERAGRESLTGGEAWAGLLVAYGCRMSLDFSTLMIESAYVQYTPTTSLSGQQD